VDEPEANVYGGVVAAPAFRNITRGALRYLGIVPDRPEALPLPQPSDGATLVRVERKAGSEVGKRPGVLEVPDFIGLSLREAVDKARALKLKVELRGNGYVVKQAPSAGAVRADGETLTLHLQG
jgi:cell division protein FtsI (penicillin-binding protein 3)